MNMLHTEKTTLSLDRDAIWAQLRDEGRRCVEVFLAEHGAHLGKRSTLDLDAMLAAC